MTRQIWPIPGIDQRLAIEPTLNDGRAAPAGADRRRPPQTSRVEGSFGSLARRTLDLDQLADVGLFIPARAGNTNGPNSMLR